MSMEELDDFSRYCKKPSVSGRGQGDSTSAIPAQLRASIYKATTGKQGNLPIGQGRVMGQFLDACDENGIPYPTFKIGPIA